METSQTDMSHMPAEKQSKESNGAGKKAVWVLVVLFALAALSAIYFYRQYSILKQDPNRVALEEVVELTEKVGKLMVLPNNEQPTIATVTDPEKLKDQAFFANASTGDKVLIYTNAKKAILYSEANNKIVEVAPLTIGNQAQQ